MSHDGADVGQLNTGYDSDGRASTPSLDMSEDGIPRPPPNPSQQALPTMLMAGTILGSIFRADLSKNKVDVETNNLRKFVSMILWLEFTSLMSILVV